MTSENVIFPTGISGLDNILGGGLDRPSLAAIIGPPGAGKTVLASNIVFNAARLGMKAIVITSFSEGVEQYIRHMRSFGFFDAALLNQSIQLFTLESLLTTADTSPALTLTRAIRTIGANIVLLDGFQGTSPLLSSDHSSREMLSTLAIQIRYLNTTLVTTIAGEVRSPSFHNEMTVADMAIGLNFTIEGRRHRRLLEVMKLRGRAQQPGLHSYTIDAGGIRVFPRIESTPAPYARPVTNERSPFHLPELDQILGGGPNVGTTSLLAGAPGVGKTTLGLHWALAQAEAEKISLFITFVEQPEQLVRKAAAFGLDLQSAIDQGTVRVIRIAPADLNPDQVAAILLAELASPNVQRLVIDDISILLNELGDRTRDYLSALNDIVYSTHTTALYLLEITPFEGLRVNLTNTPVAVLGDNVIVVQQYEIDGVLRRLLAVIRMRLSFFDRTLRELIMDEGGIRILRPEESTRETLTAGAQLSGGVAPKDSDSPASNA